MKWKQGNEDEGRRRTLRLMEWLHCFAFLPCKVERGAFIVAKRQRSSAPTEFWVSDLRDEGQRRIHDICYQRYKSIQNHLRSGDQRKTIGESHLILFDSRHSLLSQTHHIPSSPLPTQTGQYQTTTQWPPLPQTPQISRTTSSIPSTSSFLCHEIAR